MPPLGLNHRMLFEKGMPFKPVRALLAMCLWNAMFLWGGGPVLAQTALSNPLAAAVGTYCIACHNPGLAEAKVQLDARHAQRPGADAELWERVLRQLRARTMPPADNPRPDPKTYEALVRELAAALDHGDPEKAPQKDQPAPQRVADLELAARLARFLWGSGPDSALLEVARKDRLHIPEVLEAQVQRMLADARIAELVKG